MSAVSVLSLLRPCPATRLSPNICEFTNLVSTPVLAPSTSFHPACRSICVRILSVLPNPSFLLALSTHLFPSFNPLSQSTVFLTLSPPCVHSHIHSSLPILVAHLPTAAPTPRHNIIAFVVFHPNLAYPTHVSSTFLRPASHPHFQYIWIFTSSLNCSLVFCLRPRLSLLHSFSRRQDLFYFSSRCLVCYLISYTIHATSMYWLKKPEDITFQVTGEVPPTSRCVCVC